MKSIYKIFYILMCSTEIINSQSYRRIPSNVCTNNNDCPSNAYCELTSSNGYCTCRDGYVLVDFNLTKECFKVATTINDPCLVDQQCMIKLSTDSQCSNGYCQCRAGRHFVPREVTCYRSVRLGDFCRLTNECLGENTFCRDGVCICPIGTHTSSDFTRCLPNAQLGEPCNEEEECVVKESRCMGVCRCRTSHINNAENDSCLKIASRLKDECFENEQCTANIAHSFCEHNADGLSGNCTCRPGYHNMNYKCWVSVELNGICESTENCALTENAICDNGRCICVDNLTNVNGRCSNSSILRSLSTTTLILLLFCLIKFQF